MAEDKVVCRLKSRNGQEITITGDPNDKSVQDLCKAKDQNTPVYLSGYTYPFYTYYYSYPYQWYYGNPYYSYYGGGCGGYGGCGSRFGYPYRRYW